MNAMLTRTGLPQLVRANRYFGDRPVFLHSHPCTEIVLVVKGACRIQVQNTTLEGKKNCLFILPGGIAHSQHNTTKTTHTSYAIFHTHPRLFNDKERVLQIGTREFISRWLEDLCALYAMPGSPCPLLTDSLLGAIISRINQLENKQDDRKALHPRLTRAIELIESDIAAPIIVRDIAHTVHLSASHLAALFREHFGCGILQYQQKLRMQRACELLRDPYLSIGDVAMRCGYDDSNYFVRLFGNNFGHPPNRWRKIGEC